MAEKKKLLQWHAAFYAIIQIELEKEAEHLTFENEHTLSTKPMQIDVLIIKNEPGRQIRKNIGRIFREHNIMEYKSPDDYLSIDDFYKVLGYCCFYKSDTGKTDEIKSDSLTMSFVCSCYPRKLVKHLRNKQNMLVEKQEKGIYYIRGAMFPIQLLITTELSEEDNLWLRGLTNDMRDTSLAEQLVQEYGAHKHENLYESAMNIIVNANKETFDEVNGMCEALLELMKDELDAREQQGITQGITQGCQQKLEELIYKKIQKNKSVEQIAEELEESLETILPIYGRLLES